jgi:hypothetical protein
METTIKLVQGIDFFTKIEIRRKVLAFKGLSLCEGICKAFSEPIKTYLLEEKLLVALEEKMIPRQKLTDRQGKVFDEVAIRVSMDFDIEKQAILLFPSVITEGDNSIFKALVDSDDAAPAVAKELAASEASISVPFKEVFQGGLRRLPELFLEFSKGNKTIERLGRSNVVFKPTPYPDFKTQEEDWFIVEAAWPKVLQCWKSQLEELRAGLAL